MLRARRQARAASRSCSRSPTSRCIVTVNRTRIEQILVNLVINAVDAIGERTGTITIDVRAERRRQARRLRGPRHRHAASPPETLDKIFEPFFTTKAPDNGTGLGLPVVREIVAELRRRRSRSTATLGVGTTFTFDLPR